MTSGPVVPLLLSVEDDPQVRASLATWLEDSGYRVVEAADGPAGLAAFRTHAPDLVLLDMGLPGLPGMEVLRAMAAESPRTPVVVVSANAAITDAIGAFKAGAWDYVTQPILNFDMREQAIRNCLERRALREEVRRVQERHRTLLQSVPVIVFTLGPGADLEFINGTCQTITGYSPQEALAEPGWLLAHTHPDDRAALAQALEAARAGPAGALHTDFRFTHRQGYILHLHARGLERGADAPGAVAGVIADLTESVFLEKMLVQREKLNTLGAVTAELAHEIRNPLTSLGGFARRLAEAHPDLKEAGIILEQALRLEHLLERITAYAAPVPVRMQRASLTALLTFCLDRLSPALTRRRLALRLRLDPALPDVHTDPDLLTETLAAVLSRLAESMSAQAALTISTRALAGHARLDLDLDDPALAEAAEAAASGEHLLMPFEEGGATLGPALAHRNVKSLGGHLALTPRPGGLTVTVSLPLADAARQAP